MTRLTRRTALAGAATLPLIPTATVAEPTANATDALWAALEAVNPGDKLVSGIGRMV